MKQVELEAEYNDKLIIEIRKKNVKFKVSCDGTGFVVEIDKNKLLEKLK